MRPSHYQISTADLCSGCCAAPSHAPPAVYLAFYRLETSTQQRRAIGFSVPAIGFSFLRLAAAAPPLSAHCLKFASANYSYLVSNWNVWALADSASAKEGSPLCLLQILSSLLKMTCKVKLLPVSIFLYFKILVTFASWNKWICEEFYIFKS